MSIRSFGVWGVAVLLCGSNSGCYFEYQATVTCQDCVTGIHHKAVGPWACTQQDAISQAHATCGLPFLVVNPVVESRLTFSLTGNCSDARGVPAPDAIQDVVQAAAQQMNLEPQVDEATGGPTCPPRELDVKVTVFQDVPVADCPGPMGVEVSYQKYLSEGVYEATTLTGTVPVGGKQDFVCVDAGVAEFGKVGTISVRVYSDLNCVGEMPLAIGQAYSQIPADGSRVEVRANLETLMFDDEIIPPAAADTVAAVTRPALVPIPDPLFTPRRP